MTNPKKVKKKLTKYQIVQKAQRKACEAFNVWNVANTVEPETTRLLEHKMIDALSRLSVKSGSWGKFLKRKKQSGGVK